MKKFFLIFFIIVFGVGIFFYSKNKEEDTSRYEIIQEIQEQSVKEDVLENEKSPDIAIAEQNVIKTRKYDHEGLLKKNSDYLGWLYIYNTEIDYPITHGNQYLKLDFNKKKDIAGNPFIDDGYDENQKYFVIFGHNLVNSNSMFSSIKNYKNESFFKSHQDLYFNEINTLKDEKNPHYKIVGFMEFDYKKENGYNYLKTDFKNAEEFEDHKKETIKRIKFYTQDFEKLTYNQERMLVISTCDTDIFGRADYKRLVLFAIGD